MTADSAKPKRTGARLKTEVKAALVWLKRKSSQSVRAGMVRYGLPSDKAYGVPVNVIQKLGKELGCDHALAEALWQTGNYEARLLVAYVGEPERLTAAQMEHWCRDFDNWGVVDTLCFVLFDRSPLAWKKVPQWAGRTDEFQKRAGFVLLACLAAHDEEATDEKFLRLLPLIERGATDGRNFVKKGVSWALRMVGRRSVVLNRAAVAMAVRLTGSVQPSARWIGRTALRELTGPVVKKKLGKLQSFVDGLYPDAKKGGGEYSAA